jgi:hypothetical protein
MREAVWLGSALLTELLPHAYYALGGLTTRAGKRRLRLFGCACVRRVWEWLTDERSRYAVEVSERFADGEAGRDGLARAEEAATTALNRIRSHYPRDPDGAPLRPRHVREAAQAAVHVASRHTQTAAEACFNVWRAEMAARPTRPTLQERSEEMRPLCDFLRDVFGNPFRPPRLRPAWLAWNDRTIPILAQSIYAERAYDRLPILADALEDAGCAQGELLLHLRGPGPHVRGCWAVDLLRQA